MAEAPPGQKRKRDEPSGTRKRRSVRSSVEGVSAETASSLGSVAVFTDAWGGVDDAADQTVVVERHEQGAGNQEAAKPSGAAVRLGSTSVQAPVALPAR
ncbi:hypothetical protein C6341_g25106 [Phytophthora cactorum]|nr:hypothetical protein C6341_g25106 [Phytophthora cactorum]